ncbi:MAG: hypothetical protein DRH11_06065 [Deltaproteobacteria bacterium]|nr:MAG: hypothetical protein DRH11_06065 [Deltaproteobacteria bacterium]
MFSFDSGTREKRISCARPRQHARQKNEGLAAGQSPKLCFKSKNTNGVKLMGFLEKFNRFNRRISSWFEWVGLMGLLLMMFITCIDVIGAKLFLKPVLGAIDIVMLSQAVAISFVAASALLLGRHVHVEFFVVLLPKRVRAVVDSVVLIFGLGFFILIVWRLAILGSYFRSGAEVSASARIPLFPFAYGVAAASIPVCLIFIHDLINAILRVVKK